ncbi:unnamed protein product [Calypogeia fissa]
MLCSCVSPEANILWSGRGRGIISTSNAFLYVSDDSLLRPTKKKPRTLLVTPSLTEELSSLCPKTRSNLLGGLRLLHSRDDGFGLSVRTWAKPSSGEGQGDGDKYMQDLLVDLLRLETGKARVNEFVEDRSKFLTEIAQQANEEFDRIAEEAKKGMDEAGSKVLEQIDAEAADFEEELAAARAEMEANEREFNVFEKSVEKARSEGLFFKTLFTKPTKPWKAKSPEEQKEIKEKAKVVTDALDQGTKKAASSKFRRTAYAVMIFLLTLTVLEASNSENVQWNRLVVYILVLVALVVQLTYETLVSRDNKEEENENKE